MSNGKLQGKKSCTYCPYLGDGRCPRCPEDAYYSSSPTPMPPVVSQTEKTFGDIRHELQRAAKWPGFNSAHEGYAILAEEVDELIEASGYRLRQLLLGVSSLWVQVKLNQNKRDIDAMRAEAVQVAAMAVKFIEMIDAGRGRV